MYNSQTTFSQCSAAELSVEKLSDGSIAILDERSNDMHSLNASAAAVWEACGDGATLAQITANLEQRFGGPANDTASHALAQLQRAKLIECSEPIPAGLADLGRRSMLKRLTAAGAIAVPIVLTLTAVEQRASAAISFSGEDECIACQVSG